MLSNTVSYGFASHCASTTSDGGFRPARSKLFWMAFSCTSGGFVSSKANSISFPIKRFEAFSTRMRAASLTLLVAPPCVRHTVAPYIANLRHRSPRLFVATQRLSGLSASSVSCRLGSSMASEFDAFASITAGRLSLASISTASTSIISLLSLIRVSNVAVLLAFPQVAPTHRSPRELMSSVV